MRFVFVAVFIAEGSVSVTFQNCPSVFWTIFVGNLSVISCRIGFLKSQLQLISVKDLVGDPNVLSLYVDATDA